MKRGKRLLENNRIFIYVGTTIFLVLAIALGIIMYMLNKTTTKLENNGGQVAQELTENSETVSTEMGKTVEEQENSMKEDLQSDSKKEEQEVQTLNSDENKNSTTNNAKTEIATQNKQKNESTNEKVNSTNEIDEPDIATNTPANKIESKEEKEEITFIKPTEGEIICEYAKDNLIFSETLNEWITHTAIDIKADKTSVIKSAADGIIKSIVNDPRYGLTVIIEHADGYQTVYSNLLTAEFVVEGEEVKQGQTIGTAGNTASFESMMECHLHFEILKDGEYLNPSIYLK